MLYREAEPSRGGRREGEVPCHITKSITGMKTPLSACCVEDIWPQQ